VGRVVASDSGALQEGDWVESMQGWREHYTAKGDSLRKIDPALGPVSTALGVLGMPGLTAYAGIHEIGKAREGEIVLVSAAAGAVGSVAGQLALIAGCRVVGSAGSQEKVDYLTSELGFDAAFNYRDVDLSQALREHCPDRIDVCFENVGGDHLEAALGRMANFGRVALCGMISAYNLEEPPPGPRNIAALLVNRVTVRGFIVMDHYDILPRFAQEVAGHVKSGELRYRETVVEGIENMADAFIGLLSGENIGKMLVKVGPDDSGA
jgi:NADPH-dependent curcumin reductase CurA